MEGVKRILVIDDDQEVRDLLGRFLSSRGYEVETAADGDEGLVALAFDPPDLVFLDLEMPGMSGLDVMRWMRGREIEVPVIAISGHPAAKLLGPDSVRLGAGDFVAKPFDFATIEKKVEEQLGA